MENRTKYLLSKMLYDLFIMVTSGAVLQTFLLEKGFSEEKTNIYFSIVQILQVLTIMLFSVRADKIKNLIKKTAFFHLLEIPFVIFLIFFCFYKSSFGFKITFVLALTTLLFNIGLGIYNVLSYKLPFKILDMNNFGTVLSLAGMLGGILSFVFSIILSTLQKHFDYMNSMKMIFSATLIILLGFIAISASYKEKNTETPHSEHKSKSFNFFTFKPFAFLIPANLFRGFCAGIVAMSVSIGYYNKSLDSNSAAVLVIITSIDSVLGSALYSIISAKLRNGYILLISSIALFIFMPLMVITQNTMNFLIFYGIAYFFFTIINYDVPVAVTRIVGYDYMGQYSAGRMLLHILGTSLAGFLCIPLFRLIGIVPTIVLSGGLHLISGISYYFMLKNDAKAGNVL